MCCDAVIFHGVDCAQFQPPADRQALLAEVGLVDQQVIGSVGCIRPSKGTDLFVDGLLAVSRRKGFGLTPREAVATGCVPVTFKAGVWPWIVQPNFGAMLQTGSAASLASQLAQLLTDMQKLHHLVTVTREVVCRFDWIQREASWVNEVYSLGAHDFSLNLL